MIRLLVVVVSISGCFAAPWLEARFAHIKAERPTLYLFMLGLFFALAISSATVLSSGLAKEFVYVAF